MSDTNGDNKMQIECPHCSQVFGAEMPTCEIVNTERFSAVVAMHPIPVVCPNGLCQQKFVMAIGEVRAGWVAQPMARETPLILPARLKVVNRG